MPDNSARRPKPSGYCQGDKPLSSPSLHEKPRLYAALDRAQDEQERKEIERAISEWADGDTVAAHIAYGINVLCTEDRAGASIFDSSNRAWLEPTAFVSYRSNSWQPS
jgi:hypothetical protein